MKNKLEKVIKIMTNNRIKMKITPLKQTKLRESFSNDEPMYKKYLDFSEFVSKKYSEAAGSSFCSYDRGFYEYESDGMTFFLKEFMYVGII